MDEQRMTLECDAADREIRFYWTKDRDSLGAAADYLNECLSHFGFDLDHDTFFAAMPHFRDEFDYLWAFFIKWGAPKTWQEDYGPLAELSPEELCCAFAHGQVSHARFLLSEDAQSPRAQSNELARKKLQGAKRALAFVSDRMARH